MHRSPGAATTSGGGQSLGHCATTTRTSSPRPSGARGQHRHAGWSHPDIVTVLDSGSQAYAYLVMDSCRAMTCGRTPNIRSAAAARVLHAGTGVRSAPPARRDHRDIKPANVLGWTGRADLVSPISAYAGLATDASQPHGHHGRHAGLHGARTAGRVGADTGQRPVRTGGLFELLTARLPHPAASLGELLRRWPPSLRPTCARSGGTFPGIAHVVADLLERRPERRPQGRGAGRPPGLASGQGAAHGHRRVVSSTRGWTDPPLTAAQGACPDPKTPHPSSRHACPCAFDFRRRRPRSCAHQQRGLGRLRKRRGTGRAG